MWRIHLIKVCIINIFIFCLCMYSGGSLATYLYEYHFLDGICLYNRRIKFHDHACTWFPILNNECIPPPQCNNVLDEDNKNQQGNEYFSSRPPYVLNFEMLMLYTLNEINNIFPKLSYDTTCHEILVMLLRFY